MTEEQADSFNSQVTTNLKPYSYWTNFDTGSDKMFIDHITFVIWILSIVSLLGCSAVAKISVRANREAEAILIQESSRAIIEDAIGHMSEE